MVSPFFSQYENGTVVLASMAQLSHLDGQSILAISFYYVSKSRLFLVVLCVYRILEAIYFSKFQIFEFLNIVMSFLQPCCALGQDVNHGLCLPEIPARSFIGLAT